MPFRGVIGAVRRSRCARLVLAAVILAAAGCTDDRERRGADAPSLPSTPSPAAQPTAPPVWLGADVRVDRVSGQLPRHESSLPSEFPLDDAVLPDLLAEPPGRVRMAYHPRESFDDVGGWNAERVFFLGVDGGWRSLEMADLGLPEGSHPGADTYGAGALSPDGSTWAAPLRSGIVLLDLLTTRSRVVQIPGDHTRYLAWHPDGRSIDVMRLHGASTQRTWSVHPRSLKVARAPYLLPIDGFADDGSVVTFAKRGANTLRTVHRDRGKVSDVVAMPYRHARRGGAVGTDRIVFGVNRELLAVDVRSGEPIARLRLSQSDAAGWPRGWWGQDTVWFYVPSRGLLTWDVANGRTRVLTRVRPPVTDGLYWSASVARDLMR